jgi:hypothetical protein
MRAESHFPAWLKLSFFGDGNLSHLPHDVQNRLARAAREVDLDRLPDLGLSR